MVFKKSFLFSKKRMPTFVLLAIVLAVTFIINHNYPLNYSSAHSSLATPTEIFSLWNNTSPTLDGNIYFNSSSLATEWSAAAVYSMFDYEENFDSKILLQNDNTNLYIGLDLVNFQTETPVTIWGAAVYIDRDQNGIFTNNDRAIILKADPGAIVYYSSFNDATKTWTEIESNTPGVPLPASQILMNTAFDNSYFESNNHRQYEIRIPLAILAISTGNITGIGFEAFESYDSFDEEITWPYVSSTPPEIRSNARFLGDICIGKDTGIPNYYADYVIEENTNIKSDVVGVNNGVFLGTIDVDSDGDLEIIVSSNETDDNGDYLLAIYDFVDGEMTRIWSSWTTSHQSKMFQIKGIDSYDFDGNNEDELYVCGKDSRLLRFSDWNDVTKDFDQSKNVFIHSSGLMGYLAIGDPDDDDEIEIVSGDQQGKVLVLRYDSDKDEFVNDEKSPFDPPDIGLEAIMKIHAVEVADPDSDDIDEILILSQPYSDPEEPITYLQILKRGKNYDDNKEDDLLKTSSITTADYNGHTILVGDVANTGEIMTVIVGRDYLKMFEQYTYTDPSPPLELLVNDGSSSPSLAGGAIIADIDNDTRNELIFGANNGTLYIGEVVDQGASYEFILEWSSDIGSSPGNREALTVFDFDEDGENEIIVGDNFGQIQVIGKSSPPEISITSPTSGSIFSSSSVLVTWDASDDFAIHHYDIMIESVLYNRIPGSQNSLLVSIINPDNNIEIIAFDVSGKNSSDSINIGYTASAPEVHILSPENNYYVNNASIIVYFENIDPNGDFSHYEVWVNDLLLQNNTIIEWILVSTFIDGLFNITIVGVDDANNRGKSTIFITKDRSAPFISITSPITGTYTKTTELDIYWTASDAISGISHFDIIKDGEYLTTTLSFHETILLEVDKSYQFEIEAFDLLGNSRNASLTITRDLVEPNVTILSHQTGDILTSTTLNLIWECDDNYFGSGIHHSEVSINQITKYSGTDESASITLNEEGITDVLVTSFDRAGNSISEHVLLFLDVSDPFINITNPKDGYTTGFDYVLLSWESVDNGTGIKEFQVYLDGVSYQNITDPALHNALVYIPLDTSSTIAIRVLDNIDRFFVDSITVTQNSTLPEVIITDPIDYESYSSTSQIDLSWEIANMPNISSFEIYVNGTLEYTINDNTTRYQSVDLGVILVGEFPLYNITIVALSVNPNENYTATKWIIIDQSIPFISIITPENNTIVTSQGLYVQWSSNDFGSGLESYQILLDNENQFLCTCLRNYYYLNFALGDKNYTLTIVARDKANNSVSISIQLVVAILSPEIQTNLSSVYYTKTGFFNFNLSIINPRNGVNSYHILMDDNSVFSYNFYPSTLLSPYSIQINVTGSHYTILEGTHFLTVGLVDLFSRESTQIHMIIVDNESPTILPSIVIDSQVYSQDENVELTQIDDQPTQNNHSFLVTVNDNYYIDKVLFTIIGENYSQTLEMELVQETRQQTNSFVIYLDIGSLNTGEYDITITAYDNAGNTQEITLKITILPPETIPWLFQGNNLIYFSIGLFDVLLLVIVFAFAIRRPIMNRNWQEEVIAVMYVRSTGLVCTSVQYDPQQIQEEQLVGGATVAIQGILDEYSSKKDKKSTRTFDIGSKSLLLTPGEHGYGAIIVKTLKPKHKDLIKSFTKRFERKYQISLKNIYYVDSASFRNAERLVESFFGKLETRVKQITKAGISGQLKEIQEIEPKGSSSEEIDRKELLEDITPIDELLSHISREAKNRLIKVIENTPKVIIALVEHQLDQAAKLADVLANDIQYLMKIERTNKDFNYFIQTMLYLTTEIDNAVEKGLQGYIHEMQLAIERASRIWFDEIADKWSDIQ